MKKICGALVIGLMITTNSFAGQKQDCEDLKMFLTSKGKNTEWIKSLPETACVDLADLFYYYANKQVEIGLMVQDCAEALIKKENEAKQNQIRLTQCNSRNGWKY